MLLPGVEGIAIMCQVTLAITICAKKDQPNTGEADDELVEDVPTDEEEDNAPLDEHIPFDDELDAFPAGPAGV